MLPALRTLTTLAISSGLVFSQEGGGMMPAVHHDLRVLGAIETSGRTLDDGASSWITLSAEDAGHALLVASKFVADLKGFGDVRPAEGPATSLVLAGAGQWVIGLDQAKVHILFTRDAGKLAGLAMQAKAATWSPVAEQAHPRWFDRFDNDAVSMGFLGFGALPQDIDDEVAWMGRTRLNIAGNCYYQQDTMVAPGVCDFTIPDYYAKVAANNNLAFAPYTNWSAPWRPTWVWNRIPLPHITPEDGSFLAHNRIGDQAKAIYCEYEPLAATDGIMGTTYRAQAEHFASLPNCNMQFGFAEMGHLITLSLSSIAGTPEVVDAWHEYLKGTLGYDLARAGTLYRGDTRAYSSWHQLELPTIKTFAGWNAKTCRDLRGVWSIKPGDGGAEAPDVAALSSSASTGWTAMRPDDPMLLIHSGRHGDVVASHCWMKRTVSADASEIAAYRYLHISRNNVHGNTSAVCNVFINGKELKNVTKTHPTTFDYDLCYETGDALTPGENTILVDTHGFPIPGYIFLGPTGRWSYPSADPHLNRLYFDVTEFAANHRMKGVENVLRALRSGDPQGRPMQAMAPGDFVDLTFDLFDRYGAYAHDTGMSGWVWAPWMSRYYTTRGQQISSEPGGPPGNVADMRKMITLWTLLGDEAINLLFDPSQYAYRDKASVGGWIEGNQELLRCVGKMDMDRPSVGVMRSIRDASRLRLDSPWWMDLSRGDLQSVGRTVNVVDPSDLVRDRAGSWFNVILDAGSELLTEAEVSGIERFVRAGGTFVAFEHTGVHAPEKAYAWPISRLSGLEVVANDEAIGNIRFTDAQTLWPSMQGRTLEVRGTFFDFKKTEFTGNALGMEARSADVDVIAEWPNNKPGSGRIAVASRRLGNGRFITIGANFWRFAKDENGRFATEAKSRPYLDELLTSLGVPAESYRDHQAPDTGGLFAEHWLSKNGLYDLYMLAMVGKSGSEAGRYNVGFRAATPPSSLIEISAQGHPAVPVKAGVGRFDLENVELLPMQLRIFAAPRADIAQAPSTWLASLEKRWHVLPAIPPQDVPVAAKTEDGVIPVNEDWLLCSGGERWAETPPRDFDWSKAAHVRLGAFANLGLANDQMAHFRKTVAIPSAWKGTRVKLSFAAVYWHWGICPNGRLWVDGKPAPILQPLTYRADGSFMFDLTPGADGTVTLEIEVDGRLRAGINRPRPSGITGVFFLQSDPLPVQTESLNGTWLAATGLGTGLPAETGTKARYIYLEKRFTLPTRGRWPTRRPFLESPTHLGWLILNGHIVSTPGHMNRLNVSGLLQADGTENVLRWVPQSMEAPGAGRNLEGVVPTLDLVWWPDEPK